MMRLVTNILLFSLLFMMGCGDPATRNAKKRSALTLDSIDKIKIGINWFEPEEASTFANGVNLALDEINQKGILGKEFELDYRSNDGDAVKGVKIAERFGKDTDIPVVIGHYFSGIAEECIPVYIKNGLLFINIDAQLSTLSVYDHSHIFRMAPNTQQIAEFCSFAMMEMGLSKPLIISSNSVYSQDLSRRFVNLLDNMGMKPARTFTYFAGFKQDPHVLKQIQHIDFDCICFFTEPELILPQLRTIRELGENQPAISSIENRDILECDPEVYGDLYMVSFRTMDESKEASEKRKQFEKNYKNRYNDSPTELSIVGYTALHLYADMVDSVGTVSPDYIGRQLSILKNYNSVIDTISFSANGDITTRKINLVKLGNGNPIVWNMDYIWELELRDKLLELSSDSFLNEHINVFHRSDSTLSIEMESNEIFIRGTDSFSTRGRQIMEEIVTILSDELSCYDYDINISAQFYVKQSFSSIMSDTEMVEFFTQHRIDMIKDLFEASGFAKHNLSAEAKTNIVGTRISKVNQDKITLNLTFHSHDKDCNKPSHKYVDLHKKNIADNEK